MGKLRVLDLFSGIGGLTLGLDRTGGFETVAFCEIEQFPQKVLKKHWPEVPIYDDIKELTGQRLAADGITVDVITAGFPCQDISTAGGKTGLQGKQSGLYYEVARLISELEPRVVILENVAALLRRGLSEVLGELASIGYDAEWNCISAAYLGAPHRRDRIWIMAYPSSSRGTAGLSKKKDRRQGHSEITKYLRNRFVRGEGCSHWAVEPDVGRVAHGVSNRAHRIKGLGNAVVPQIPEMIGYAILEAIDKQDI